MTDYRISTKPKRYVNITTAQFEQAIRLEGMKWNTKFRKNEQVYFAFIPGAGEKRLVIRSSLGADGTSHPRGKDSIRVRLEYWNPEAQGAYPANPTGGGGWYSFKKSQRYTQRTAGWELRLYEKVLDLLELAYDTEARYLGQKPYLVSEEVAATITGLKYTPHPDILWR